MRDFVFLARKVRCFQEHLDSPHLSYGLTRPSGSDSTFGWSYKALGMGGAFPITSFSLTTLVR